MKSNRSKNISFWTSILFLALSSLVAAQSYTVNGLGVGGGALAINGEGAAAGFLDAADGSQHAFFWTRDKGVQDLGTLHGDHNSYAQSLNNTGQVVGWSVGPQTERPFLWTASGGMHFLGSLGGKNGSAFGINNSGEVVGQSLLADGVSLHAFSWTKAGGMHDLGTLGGTESSALAINDAGEIVGYSFLADNVTIHGFLWTQSGGMQDLGTLGGAWSMAVAINSIGHVVGWSYTAAGDPGPAAFLWSTATGMRSLGVGDGSAAQGINIQGQVVGYVGVGPQFAFVRTRANLVENLKSILPSNSVGNGINDAGQIAATDITLGAVLLTPVPE